MVIQCWISGIEVVLAIQYYGCGGGTVLVIVVVQCYFRT